MCSELVETGRLKALEKLRRSVPPGARDLLSLPGMGPVRVRALITGLHVNDRADLERALTAGRLTKLRGFGPVLQSRLQAALAVKAALGASKRLPLSIAAQYAEPLRQYLSSLPGVSQVELAGSYRRGRDTVGDLDLVVCAPSGAELFKALVRYPDLRDLSASGTTKAAGVLRNGLQIDVRVVPPENFGAALHYFTPVGPCGWSDLGTPKRVAEVLRRGSPVPMVPTDGLAQVRHFSLTAQQERAQLAGRGNLSVAAS